MKKLLLLALLVSATGLASAQWKYDKKKDAMTDVETVGATLISPTKVQLAFPYAGGTSGLIRLQQKGRGAGLATEAFFAVSKGQIVEAGGIVVRFDDGDPITFSASSASDGSTQLVFFDFPARLDNCIIADTTPISGESSSDWTRRYEANKAVCELDEKKFIRQLALSKRLRLKVTLFNSGSYVFEFKPQGLKLPDSQ